MKSPTKESAAMNDESNALRARIERNKGWAAKFGEQSPIRVNEIDPNTACLEAALAQIESLTRDVNDAREVNVALLKINSEEQSRLRAEVESLTREKEELTEAGCSYIDQLCEANANNEKLEAKLEEWQRMYREIRVSHETVWRERDTLRAELKLMEHKVITCGVAASHPDPKLTLRADYMKWDSPQAEQVRTLRAELDALAREKNEAIAGQSMWQKRFGMADADRDARTRERDEHEADIVRNVTRWSEEKKTLRAAVESLTREKEDALNRMQHEADKRDEAEKQIESITREKMALHGELAEALQASHTLRAELDAAKVDAEKYRWLRTKVHVSRDGVGIPLSDGRHEVVLTKRDLYNNDRAVDAAINTARARPGTAAEETR